MEMVEVEQEWMDYTRSKFLGKFEFPWQNVIDWVT